MSSTTEPAREPLRLVLRDEVTPGDLARVEAIVRSTGMFNAEEVGVAVELVDECLRRGPSSGYAFVFAELGGRTVGYACYGRIAGTESSFDLYWIAVLRDCQRSGVGRALLAEVERRVRALGGRQIYVDTSGRAQYEPTRAFYHRCGYQPEAVLRDFFAPGDDKVICVKRLAP